MLDHLPVALPVALRGPGRAGPGVQRARRRRGGRRRDAVLGEGLLRPGLRRGPAVLPQARPSPAVRPAPALRGVLEEDAINCTKFPRRAKLTLLQKFECTRNNSRVTTKPRQEQTVARNN